MPPYLPEIVRLHVLPSINNGEDHLRFQSELSLLVSSWVIAFINEDLRLKTIRRAIDLVGLNYLVSRLFSSHYRNNGEDAAI
jgi:hypothetical protein